MKSKTLILKNKTLKEINKKLISPYLKKNKIKNLKKKRTSTKIKTKNKLNKIINLKEEKSLQNFYNFQKTIKGNQYFVKSIKSFTNTLLNIIIAFIPLLWYLGFQLSENTFIFIYSNVLTINLNKNSLNLIYIELTEIFYAYILFGFYIIILPLLPYLYTEIRMLTINNKNPTQFKKFFSDHSFLTITYFYIGLLYYQKFLLSYELLYYSMFEINKEIATLTYLPDLFMLIKHFLIYNFIFAQFFKKLIIPYYLYKNEKKFKISYNFIFEFRFLLLIVIFIICIFFLPPQKELIFIFILSILLILEVPIRVYFMKIKLNNDNYLNNTKNFSYTWKNIFFRIYFKILNFKKNKLTKKSLTEFVNQISNKNKKNFSNVTKIRNHNIIYLLFIEKFKNIFYDNSINNFFLINIFKKTYTNFICFQNIYNINILILSLHLNHNKQTQITNQKIFFSKFLKNSKKKNIPYKKYLTKINSLFFENFLNLKKMYPDFLVETTLFSFHYKSFFNILILFKKIHKKKIKRKINNKLKIKLNALEIKNQNYFNENLIIPVIIIKEKYNNNIISKKNIYKTYKSFFSQLYIHKYNYQFTAILKKNIISFLRTFNKSTITYIFLNDFKYKFLKKNKEKNQPLNQQLLTIIENHYIYPFLTCKKSIQLSFFEFLPYFIIKYNLNLKKYKKYKLKINKPKQIKEILLILLTFIKNL